MAAELSDLPADAIEHAISMWRRGDTRHLSDYEKDHARVGAFFPKPAELRAIASHYLREQRRQEHSRRLIEEIDARERRRKENPEEYVSVESIVADVAEKKKLDLVQKAAQSPAVATCPGCGTAIPVQPLTASGFAALRPADLRALADVREKQLKLQAEQESNLASIQAGEQCQSS